MQIRACRDCGEEYRPDAPVSECSDCGGPIETRAEGGESGQTQGRPAPDAAGPYRRLYAAGAAAELEPLAERLGRARIPFNVRTSRHGFELWIPVSEKAHAREVLGDLLPAATEENTEVTGEPGPVRCPACDTEVAAGTVDCPECGLAVGAIEAYECPECGDKIDPETSLCPSCAQ